MSTEETKQSIRVKEKREKRRATPRKPKLNEERKGAGWSGEGDHSTPLYAIAPLSRRTASYAPQRNIRCKARDVTYHPTSFSSPPAPKVANAL
ncbi:unnamed protein product [Bursaphelenchus okinawaensis]|uniref:Uncharacterized protein n=1 Tax=Bursaphelenchus okinawaensis TaxID=465554 RepID=A0A811JUF1_9BILA|nr:unnamed protein product [Bursaphelenchus okinawaensis]CAG9083731.1 unnamed protein product [Bursaphelenchus okinawaensis]